MLVKTSDENNSDILIQNVTNWLQTYTTPVTEDWMVWLRGQSPAFVLVSCMPFWRGVRENIRATGNESTHQLIERGQLFEEKTSTK